MFHRDILQDKKNIVSNQYISTEIFMHSLISQDWKRQYYKEHFKVVSKSIKKAII